MAGLAAELLGHRPQLQPGASIAPGLENHVSLTRYTTEEERANIVGVTVNDQDLQHVLDLVSKGVVQAAQRHEAAVQDDMALSYAVSVELARPVQGDNGQPEIFRSREEITGRLTATKHYADEGRKPVVE